LFVNGERLDLPEGTDMLWRGDRQTVEVQFFVTGVEQLDGGVPAIFALEQNYPNPFNPSTMLRFQVPEVSNVEITIHDLLGRRIAVLVNQVMEPGVYAMPWNAVDEAGVSVAGGTYFYRMRAGSFVKTMKLTLMK
jgi:hypothetical protein